MLSKSKSSILILLLCGATSNYAIAKESTVKNKSQNSNSAQKNVKSPASLVGTWKGGIQIGNGMELPLLFHFQKSGSVYSGTLDSPDQGMKGMPFDSVSLDSNGKVQAIVEKLRAHYDGTLNGEKKEIAGFWSQGGGQTALNLKQSEGYQGPKRPQEPHKPFPYRSDDITFKSGGIDIAGTLTIPQGKGPFPAIVLIHGSGPHDRDETIFSHKPFLLLSDYLTRRGIAVLRYDKHGCGKSKGDYKTSNSETFAVDAQNAIEFLKSKPEIDAKKIGLLGHSEGGLIAPMVAAKSNDVHYIVSLAGSALPGDEILISQVKALGKGEGSSAEHIDKSIDVAKKTYAIIKAEADNQKAIEKIKEMRKQENTEEYQLSDEKRKQAEATIDGGFKAITSPWYRFFLSYDPAQAWSNVHCPVLALNGEKDMQVVADENLSAIKSALQKANNQNLTEIKFPGLNHLFQNCKTGLPAEYAKIEETMSPTVLKAIADWVEKTTKP